MNSFTDSQQRFLTDQRQKEEVSVCERHASDSPSFPRASTSVVHFQDGAMRRKSCTAICEREFRIYVNGKPLVTLLCSHVALKELAYGFLYSEQVIQSLDEVRRWNIDEREMAASFELVGAVQKPDCPTLSSGFGGKVLCSHELAAGRQGDLWGKKGFARNAFSESALLRGDFDNALLHENPRTISEVLAAMKSMREGAQEYTVTRGMHCSALFKEGVLLASFEDIGRHNTFDKLLGYCLLEGQSSKGTLLTTTGRVSGEMMRKALRFGVAGVASFSGPTDVAISLAQDAGVLLVGYANKTSATIYSGAV